MYFLCLTQLFSVRGCAYACFSDRPSASKAIEALRGHTDRYMNNLKVDSAPGVSIKDSRWKGHWSLESGTTYIPYSELPDDLTTLCAGGIVDEDSIPEKCRKMGR